MDYTFPFRKTNRKFWIWIIYLSNVGKNGSFCLKTIKNVIFLNLRPLIIHWGSQPNSSWKSAKPTQLHILALQINFSLLPTPGANKHHLTLYWFLWWISHSSPILRGFRGIYEIHGIRAALYTGLGFSLPHSHTKLWKQSFPNHSLQPQLP